MSWRRRSRRHHARLRRLLALVVLVAPTVLVGLQFPEVAEAANCNQAESPHAFLSEAWYGGSDVIGLRAPTTMWGSALCARVDGNPLSASWEWVSVEGDSNHGSGGTGIVQIGGATRKHWAPPLVDSSGTCAAIVATAHPQWSIGRAARTQLALLASSRLRMRVLATSSTCTTAARAGGTPAPTSTIPISLEATGHQAPDLEWQPRRPTTRPRTR